MWYSYFGNIYEYIGISLIEIWFPNLGNDIPICSYSLTVRGPMELAKEFATSDDVTTWSLRRLATKLCFQYIQTRSSFLFCFTHIYNVWNILMAYIWFMQWLVQILYPYIYIYYAFIWNSVGWGRGEPFRIPCAQTASIFSATGEAVWVCMACIQSAQPSHALCVLDWGWRLDILSDHRF